MRLVPLQIKKKNLKTDLNLQLSKIHIYCKKNLNSCAHIHLQQFQIFSLYSQSKKHSFLKVLN